MPWSDFFLYRLVRSVTAAVVVPRQKGGSAESACTRAALKETVRLSSPRIFTDDAGMKMLEDDGPLFKTKATLFKTNAPECG